MLMMIWNRYRKNQRWSVLSCTVSNGLKRLIQQQKPSVGNLFDRDSDQVLFNVLSVPTDSVSLLILSSFSDITVMFRSYVISGSGTGELSRERLCL